MKLRGIEFGNIFSASGTLNFFGQGWRPYHPLYKIIWPNKFNFKGSTFISKTTTLNMNEGNMRLGKNQQPIKWFPDCVKVNFRKGIVLNAVGLSSPGINYLLDQNIWQKIEKPFEISIACVGKNEKEMLVEAWAFVKILKERLSSFKKPICLQLNISCPNVELGNFKSLETTFKILEILNELGVPIDLKISVVDINMAFIREIQNSKLCDCITCSNTIKWGKMESYIDWEDLYGTSISPLKKYGGGGFSGKPLLPLVERFLKDVKRLNLTIPIKAGGGISCKEDAKKFIKADAKAIEISSVAILRPWKVQGIIKCTNEAYKKKNM